jgi:hypothetical protein
MEVRDGQQLGFAPLEPLCPRQILALGAVAIAARVIAEAFMLAVAATFPMTAQGRGPATFDGSHQAVLMREQSMVDAVPRSVAAEDVGHFEGGAAHGVGLIVVFFWDGLACV